MIFWKNVFYNRITRKWLIFKNRFFSKTKNGNFRYYYTAKLPETTKQREKLEKLLREYTAKLEYKPPLFLISQEVVDKIDGHVHLKNGGETEIEEGEPVVYQEDGSVIAYREIKERETKPNEKVHPGHNITDTMCN